MQHKLLRIVGERFFFFFLFRSSGHRHEPLEKLFGGRFDFGHRLRRHHRLQVSPQTKDNLRTIETD